MRSNDTVTAHIAIGSNILPFINIPEALDHLSNLYSINGISCFYRSRPINRPEQGDYLNGMVRIITSLSPIDLKMNVLRPLETLLGRKRSGDKYASRQIDLDIVLYGSLILNDPELTIPDPDILVRPFLMIPLLELDPDIILPGMGEPLRSRYHPSLMHDLHKEELFSTNLKERFYP